MKDALHPKELKKQAEKLAGPLCEWLTAEERNIYIKGILDGANLYQYLLNSKANKKRKV